MTRSDDRTFLERLNEFFIRRIVRTKERVGRLVDPGSKVFLLVFTAAGVAAVLRELHIPNEKFWKDGWSTYALAALACLSYVGYCFVVIGFNLLFRHTSQNTRLEAPCRDVASLVAKHTGIPLDCIGVHVWTIRGLPGFRRLERRARFTTVERTTTNITWRKGKGVLGQCWARDDWILADLTRVAMAASGTEREFYAIPREDRFMFTQQEAHQTSHYKAILGWPLHGGPPNGRKVIGVMSVDVNQNGSVAKLDNAWTNHRVDYDAHLAVCEGILKG